MKISMDNIYRILHEEGGPLSFKAILEKLNFCDYSIVDKNELSSFYTNLLTDGRFAITEDNKIDLSSRQPSHIDKYWDFGDDDDDYSLFDDDNISAEADLPYIDDAEERESLIKEINGEDEDYLITQTVDESALFDIDDSCEIVDEMNVGNERPEDFVSNIKTSDECNGDSKIDDFQDESNIKPLRIKKLSDIDNISLTSFLNDKPTVKQKIMVAEYFTKIVGVTYEKRQELIKNAYKRGLLDEGQLLMIRHNPKNPFDSNCVEVCLASGECLGYIAKERNKQIVDDLKNGYIYVVKSNCVTGLDKSTIGLNIHIEVYKND